MRLRVIAILSALTVAALAGCGSYNYKWRSHYDPPMNHAGREQVCLYNLERILDAKQEWQRETGARRGQLAPSLDVLTSKYLRRYEYGRRDPCDDDTQRRPMFNPRCPRHGQYIIGAVGERPKCSACGDLLRDYDQHIRVRHTH